MRFEGIEVVEAEAAERKDAKKEKDYTNIVMIAVVIIVFASVFFLVRGASGNEYELNGVRVVSGEQPINAMKRIFSKPIVLLQENLVAGNSSKNSVVAIQSAQIANTFRVLKKTLYAYGVVDGKPAIECNNHTNNCSGASIIVGVGSCNCIRVENDVVVVEGTEEWFSKNNYENVMRVAGVIGGVLQEIK